MCAAKSTFAVQLDGIAVSHVLNIDAQRENFQFGNAEAAIQVEKLGNQLAQILKVDILCGYSLASFQGGMGNYIFEKICAEHSAVYSR
jgi:hypothetical protein